MVYRQKSLNIGFLKDQIEKLQSVKLYDLDEKQILKIRERLQSDDINQLIEFLKAAE